MSVVAPFCWRPCFGPTHILAQAKISFVCSLVCVATDGPQCPVVGIRCPTDGGSVLFGGHVHHQSRGRGCGSRMDAASPAVQKTPKVQGRVQCLEAAVAALGPEDGCSEDRDRGRIATSQGREAGRSIAPASPVGLPTLSRSGRESGSPGSNKLFKPWEICSAEGRHVSGSSKASSPISARTSSRQSNFRVHTFHRAVDTSPRKDRRRTGGGGGSLSKRHVPDRRVSKLNPRCAQMCPMSTATKNRFGRDCRIGRVEGEASFHGTGARRGTAPACKRQAMSRTLMVREGDPSTNPRFDDPHRIVILDGTTDTPSCSGPSQLGTRFPLRD